MTSDETRIRELAERHGFISGARCGYSDAGLWVRDSEGGGSASVYPVQGRWVVAFFGPGKDVPFSSDSFDRPEQAFSYAAPYGGTPTAVDYDEDDTGTRIPRR